jgi:hypothetical protein
MEASAAVAAPVSGAVPALDPSSGAVVSVWAAAVAGATCEAEDSSAPFGMSDSE